MNNLYSTLLDSLDWKPRAHFICGRFTCDRFTYGHELRSAQLFMSWKCRHRHSPISAISVSDSLVASPLDLCLYHMSLCLEMSMLDPQRQEMPSSLVHSRLCLELKGSLSSASSRRHDEEYSPHRVPFPVSHCQVHFVSNCVFFLTIFSNVSSGRALDFTYYQTLTYSTRISGWFLHSTEHRTGRKWRQ